MTTGNNRPSKTRKKPLLIRPSPARMKNIRMIGFLPALPHNSFMSHVRLKNPMCHISSQHILCVTSYQVNKSNVSSNVKSTSPMCYVTSSQQILRVTSHEVNKSYKSPHVKSTNPMCNITSSQQILRVTSRHVTSRQQILCVTSLNINKSYVSHVK